MFRRRRPLLRAAMVGGTAYAVGKHVQSGRDQDAEQDAPVEAEQQQPGSGAISDAAIDELRKLADLNKEGVLTDAEFETQKQKLLQGA